MATLGSVTDMFSKVLIANRGEIAVRICQTLQEMGIASVAVFSDPDALSPHVHIADEAYRLPGSAASETYLRGDLLVEIALRCGADAIHPGYGFLSENAGFSQQCKDAGVCFIGPAPEMIRALGDKIEAKKLADGAGVPVVAGWTFLGEIDHQAAAERARAIGFPVLVKAAAGGGGKGMRIAGSDDELGSAIASAQREAEAAFGDSRVFLEKYIEAPRHVEVQIFGDAHGDVVHLFERECSIQRRHQKIIEESPSLGVTPALRNAMCDAAVRLATVIGYTNAGTVEFLVDAHGDFYFLEVNTRLQVEHAVTESITGIDLVLAQVLVAAGERLPFKQNDIQLRGHALECRIYAEDPHRGFLPSTGTIEHFVAPLARNVRIDSGVESGSEVSVYYDPMLAKMIVWGADRKESIARMVWALDRFVVLGVTTNVEYLRSILLDDDFASGRIDTGFLNRKKFEADAEVSDLHLAAAAVLSGLNHNGRGLRVGSDPAAMPNPWVDFGAWRGA